VILCFCLLSYEKLYCQDESKNDLRIGLNLGAYDGYDLFEMKSPILFTEYNVKLKDFLYAGPLLLIGQGKDSHDYTDMNVLYKQYSVTTTLQLGFLIKLLPFPKKFDNIKFVQGLTYLYEERYLLNTASRPNWNGKYIDKGFNYVIGLDIDFLKLKKMKLGGDIRLNTSGRRELTMYCGLVSSFEL
jgi:hypothetical protein